MTTPQEAQPSAESDAKNAERYQMWKKIKLKNLIPGNLAMAEGDDEIDRALDAAIAQLKQGE